MEEYYEPLIWVRKPYPSTDGLSIFFRDITARKTVKNCENLMSV
jgi:hypothetical protein